MREARAHVGEVQRARLLVAAAGVLADGGFEQLSVARIIEGARVSRRTFYDVFEDREDCFLAVFEDALARVSERVMAAYEQDGEGLGWRERVRAGLWALLGFFDEEPAVARLLVVHALRGGQAVLARRAEVLALVAGEIQARGALAHEDGGGELSGLTGEGVVGGVLGVVHTRLSSRDPGRLLGLSSSLMAVIVLPYEGSVVAREELRRAAPGPVRRGRARAEREREERESLVGGLLAGVPMRLTYRTLCVLEAIADVPGASNREVGERAGTRDQGQISKLLKRLEGLGLIANSGAGQARGERNAWTLTTIGGRVVQQLSPPRVLDGRDGVAR